MIDYNERASHIFDVFRDMWHCPKDPVKRAFAVFLSAPFRRVAILLWIQHKGNFTWADITYSPTRNKQFFFLPHNTVLWTRDENSAAWMKIKENRLGHRKSRNKLSGRRVRTVNCTRMYCSSWLRERATRLPLCMKINRPAASSTIGEGKFWPS